MAQFVVHVGLQPSEYWGLTWIERNAIMTEHNRKTKARNRRR